MAPDSGEENWEPVGEPVDAGSAQEALEKVAPTDAGRYLVTNDASLEHGSYFRVEPDGTVVPVDAF